ncbi:MAG: hypothetical protein AB2806_18230 [Candidatus Thiodiazotropha sp.]
MVNIPREPTISELNRKLKRLEFLVMALVASDEIGFGGDPDHLFYMFRRSFRDMEDLREDRDFYRFFEHFLYESGERGHGLRKFLHRLEDRMGEAQKELQYSREHSEEKIHALSKNIEAIEKNQKTTSKELHNYLIYQYLGEDLSSIKLDRFIPVRVYLSEENTTGIRKVSDAIDKLLTAFGFEFSDDFPAEKGSWWKKWFAKSKEVATQPEVTDRLEKIERALEIKGLHKPQSEVDKAQAEAIATLTAATQDIPNVAIQAGSILLVKTTDGNKNPCLQVRTLSTKELIYLENNQHLLCKPATVMKSLSKGANHPELTVAEKK